MQSVQRPSQQRQSLPWRSRYDDETVQWHRGACWVETTSDITENKTFQCMTQDKVNWCETQNYWLTTTECLGMRSFTNSNDHNANRLAPNLNNLRWTMTKLRELIMWKMRQNFADTLFTRNAYTHIDTHACSQVHNQPIMVAGPINYYALIKTIIRPPIR